VADSKTKTTRKMKMRTMKMTETCYECDGEGCLDCIKPCESNCHELDEDVKTFSHATGDGEWAVCKTCGYGVQQLWCTEYVGERITSADNMDNILEELR
tara:strand:- start:44 stop:340 length:297 start_codon:yes stop_codon:yes gene_type:complete